MRCAHVFLAASVLICLAAAAEPDLDKNSLSIGPVFRYLNYREIINTNDYYQLFDSGEVKRFVGTPKSTEEGLLLGPEFRYIRSFHPVPLKISPGMALLLGPDNTYDGSTQEYDSYDSTVTFAPVIAKKTNMFLFGRFLVYYSLVRGLAEVDFGTGLLGSLWLRSGSGLSRETYYWLNIPVEISARLHLSRIFDLSITGMGAPMVYGAVNLGTSPMFTLFSGYRFDADPAKLGNRYSYRFDAMAHFRISPSLEIAAGPCVEGYQFGKSDVAQVRLLESGGIVADTAKWLEPASITTSYGLNLRVIFHPGAKRKNEVKARDEEIEQHDSGSNKPQEIEIETEPDTSSDLPE